jgi:hypothetical protein
MAPKSLSTALASSWASDLPLPNWLTSAATAGKSKVRLVGVLDAMYLEHSRLVVAAGDDLIWVLYDDKTRFQPHGPDQLKIGQKLQVDGVLQASRLQASRITLLNQIL